MAKTSIASNEWAKSGFKDFVVEELVSAPFTQIQNRAQVSNSLKPMMGVERILFRSINLVPGEFGPNGEPVWEVDTKDSRFRLVGADVAAFNTGTGASIQINSSALTSCFWEFTFFGTGLNLIGSAWASAADVDLRVTVDGGSESADVHVTSSSILSGRNYSPNSLVTIVSGLSLGWHTVKVRRAGGANSFGMNGVEILNERTDILCASGSAFSSMQKESLLTSTASSYNASVTGTRGGRIIKYIKDGVISEAFRAVDTTSKFLTNTDHSNEEAVRKVHFREFGANRSSDDFQTLTGSRTSAFTLEDGTMTLVGNGANTDGTVLRPGGSGDGGWVTLTFIGTGLDIIRQEEGSSGSSTTAILVDGVNVGNLDTANSNHARQVKIASGLPYGTHTVQIRRTTVSVFNMGLTDFIVYQPKKPALPVGAIELADYNVMADYVAPAATADFLVVPFGTMYKVSSREFYYVGGGWSISGPNTSFPTSGWGTFTSTGSEYMEYSFYGTGFVLDLSGTGGGNSDFTVTIDGALNASGVAIINSANLGGGSYRINISASVSKIAFSGLSLGKHTVRLTRVTQQLGFVGMHIITPIHSHDKGFYKIGNLSLQDSRITKPIPIAEKSIDLTKAKAWIVFDATNVKILSSYNVAAVQNPSTGIFDIYWTRPFKNRPVIAGTHQGDGGLQVPTSGAGGQDLSWKNAARVITRDNAGNATATASFSIVAFGELENEETQ